MTQRAPRLLELFQLAVGLMDSTTGLLLLFFPLGTLHLMRITQVPESGIFVSFVGAFVLGVGLTYLGLLVRYWRGKAGTREWEGQWQSTSIIRAMVALALLVQIALGHMASAWLSVVCTDGGIAILQWVGSWQGWLRYRKDARV